MSNYLNWCIVRMLKRMNILDKIGVQKYNIYLLLDIVQNINDNRMDTIPVGIEYYILCPRALQIMHHKFHLNEKCV